MNRYLLGLVFLVFPLQLPAASPDFSTMEELGGAMIGNADAKFGFFVYQGDAKRFLVLKKLTGHENAKALWSQLDYIRLPDFSDGFRFVYVMCQLNGKFDPSLAAIAEITETQMLGAITHAWRADTNRGKIVSVPTKGVTCTNEAYGL